MKSDLALKFLLSIDSKIIKYGLQRTIQLLEMCGNPHNKLQSMQVVGTNGKGSTSAMIAKVLMENNYKVGLYTSPHLVTIHERIRINNIMISNEYMNQFIHQYKIDLDNIQPSFFEIMTVIALKYFADYNVDFAVLETGLGGRYDSVTAALSDSIIYTPIDIDHISLLGNTLTSIAKEKAGAISSQTSFIFSTIQHKVVQYVLDAHASKFNKKILYDTDILLDDMILPKHQIQNMSLANKVLRFLQKPYQLKLKNIQDNLKKTIWPGRLQIIQQNPTVIFDVAHNRHGLQAFIDFFITINSKYKRKYLIVGFEAGKNIHSCIQQLYKLFDFVVITETQIRKSMPYNELKEVCSPSGPVTISVNLNAYNAIQETLQIAEDNDIIIILGSHYFGPVVAQIFKNSFDIE